MVYWALMLTYRLFFIPLFVVIFPLLTKLLRRGGYRQQLSHRFGWYGSVLPEVTQCKRIWIQVVSVGELQAALPLLQRLAQQPRYALCITTTTTTAYQLLCVQFSNTPRVWLGYLPFDFVVRTACMVVSQA